MNASQLRHANDRLLEIFREKYNLIEKDPKYKTVSLTPKQITEALRNGDCRVLPKAVSCYPSYIRDFITFPAEDGDTEKEKAKEKARSSLKDRYEALKDQIVLGKAPEVLKLLREFAKS